MKPRLSRPATKRLTRDVMDEDLAGVPDRRTAALQTTARVVMNFPALLDALNQASGFELYRLRAAIDRVLGEPRWLILYTSINLDGADVRIRETPRQGLGRHDVAVGDVVSFLDRAGQQQSGKVTRLNDKSVTLHTQGQKWRVP